MSSLLGPSLSIANNVETFCSENLNGDYMSLVTANIPNLRVGDLGTCQNIPSRYLRLLELKSQPINSKEDLHTKWENLLIILSKDFKDEIQDLKVQALKNRIIYLKSYIDFLQRLNKFLNSKILDRSMANKLIEEISNFPPNLITDLYQVGIYIKVFNEGRAERLLKEIIRRPYSYYVFRPFPISVNGNLPSFFNFEGNILKFLNKNLKKENSDFLFLYLEKLWPALNSGLEDFKISFSLQEIRSFSSSFKKGATFPTLWRESLASRSSNKDIQNFMETVWDFHFQIDEFHSILWTFGFHTPSKRKIREKAFVELNELLNSSSIHDKLLLTTILENEEIFNFLKRREIIQKPLFLLKRSFYKELYKDSNYSKVAALMLFFQGERTLENAVWAMI